MNFLQQLFITIQQNPLLLILYTVYSLSLKGFSLWKAARNSHKYWFIALLVINLLGIPELLYIFIFSKKQLSLPTKKLISLPEKKPVRVKKNK